MVELSWLPIGKLVCLCTYVYIMVCMCTTVVVNISWSGGVDLWRPADESTLSDANSPLEELLASLSVPVQVTGKGLCLWVCTLESGASWDLYRDTTMPFGTYTPYFTTTYHRSIDCNIHYYRHT